MTGRDIRLKVPAKSEMDAAQRELFEEITTGPRARDSAAFRIADADGRLLGLFGPMIAHPVVGRAVQNLGTVIRYDSQLDALAREMVILRVAARYGCEFEWMAHSAIAQRLGVDSKDLGWLRNMLPPPSEGFPGEVTASIMLCDALLGRASLTTEDFESLREAIGERGIIEVVVAAGYYAMLADFIRVFDIHT